MGGLIGLSRVNIDDYLDKLVGPRPNGSAAIEDAARFIEETLRNLTPNVEVQQFQATPWGLALLNTSTLVLILLAVILLHRRRHAASLIVLAAIPALVFVEMELLWSPISGLITAPARNIVASFPGPIGSPLVVFSAHYDTATQFGDHVHWLYTAVGCSLAMGLALCLAVAGLIRSRDLSRRLLRVTLPIVVLPFSVAFVQQSVGPMVREPSPGALDNAGSVAVLLKLADSLSKADEERNLSVELVFLSCEEERALGSQHFARDLETRHPGLVVNLEALGSPGKFAFANQERFLIRSYLPSASAVSAIQAAAKSLDLAPPVPMPLPGVMYTDGRSFLAAGLPAVTLLSHSEGGPRALHSVNDSRQRLSSTSLAQAHMLLQAVLAHAAQQADKADVE